MGVHSIHADRPPSCVEPRPHTSESQRRHHYGDVQSMDREALLERIASYLPKLFWITAGFGVGGAVGIIAWHIGWFAWRMVG